MTGAFLVGFAAAGLVLQVLLWALQQRTRNAAGVDVGVAAASEGDVARRVLVASLAAAWALRLAAYLVRDRLLRATSEDGRYGAMRERWGVAASRNFLWLHLAQVPVAGLFVVPLAAAMREGALDAWDVAGVGLWGVAVAGELLADRQLERFRADPMNRGAVCRVGLWRFSRHPNYFFEWLHWGAYVLVGRAAPLTLLGPVLMLLFLLRVTGIPYTERQALRSRGEAYRAYQRTTSAFFPWPPKEVAS